MDMFKKFAEKEGLIIYSDMEDEMKFEAKEFIQDAIEKTLLPGLGTVDAACQMIKQQMDVKFGPYWHVIIGEGFSFEITWMTKATLYMYYGGKYATLVFKC